MIQPQGVLDAGETGAGTVDVVGCATEVGVTAVVEGTVLAGKVVVVAGWEVVLVVAGAVVVTCVVAVAAPVVVVAGSVAAVATAWIEVTIVGVPAAAGVVCGIEPPAEHEASERAPAVRRISTNILGVRCCATIWSTLDGRLIPGRHTPRRNRNGTFGR